MRSISESEIPVASPDGTYSLHVGPGLLMRFPADLVAAGRCAIITNSRVGTLYAPRLRTALQAAGIKPYTVEIPEGEKFKTLSTVSTIMDRLIDAQLDRQSTLLALGGGVVGDVAGFAAATFLRGVPLVQLPTTLLSMVDASIGGKVAVDHPRGKNLIGAFKSPRAVIADTSVLDTLPEAEWRSGMAEVVKHAIISGENLFEQLEQSDYRTHLGDWIESAMRVKAEIVARDPFERNERALLNLGHTFGHALEQLEHYTMRHGDAVAIGLVCAMRLAELRGMLSPGLAERVEGLLSRIGLPTRVPDKFSEDAILQAMQSDKKRAGARLRFVLPRGLGDVVLEQDVQEEEIRDAIRLSRHQPAPLVPALG